MGSTKALPLILGNHFPLHGYPENLQTDAIEGVISASLPEIAGLGDASLSGEHRLTVFKDAAASQLRAFIQAHGDPFGCAVTQADEKKIVEEIGTVGA